IVIHHEDGFWPGPNAEIRPRREGLQSCAHFRARCPRRPFKDTFKILAPAIPGSESERLSQLNDFISGVLQRRCRANRTSRWSGRLHIDSLARPAESNWSRRPQRVRLLYGEI